MSAPRRPQTQAAWSGSARNKPIETRSRQDATKMALSGTADDDKDGAGSSQWSGVEDTMEDTEETRVIFAALDSFSQYGKSAHLNCTHIRRQAFYALPTAHWQRLARPPFSYLETLDRIDDAIESNAELARQILQHGLPSVGRPDAVSAQGQARMPPEWAGIAKRADLDKARSTLRQFYRDWTAEGGAERQASYGPVFRALERERARARARARRDPDRLGPLRVLVPGAGLGRLVFELCRRGYRSEGNEISYHQLLASYYILNHVGRAGQHTLYPWLHSFSNHESRARQLAAYSVPDVHVPTAMDEAAAEAGTMTMVAADFLCLYGDDEHRAQYDAIAAVFFLDTAPNPIRYLEVMWSCLSEGGVIIFVGPLQWHFEGRVPSHHGYDGDGDGDGDGAGDGNGNGNGNGNRNGEGGRDGDGDGNESQSQGIADPGSVELTGDEVIALVEAIGFVVEHRETGLPAPYLQDMDSMLRTIYQASHWVARKPHGRKMWQCDTAWADAGAEQDI